MAARFSNFSKLPPELRLRIWLLSFQQRRLIEIRTDDYPANIGYMANARGESVSDVRWVTKSPPPSALSVCREARHLALQFWTVRFSLLAGGDEVIYINPALDTIYVNVKYIQFLPILLRDIQGFDSSDRGVRSLAIVTGLFNSGAWILKKDPMLLRDLDMLTLVLESELGGPYGYLDTWEEGSALVAPETRDELKRWEISGKGARRLLFESAGGRLDQGGLCIAAIRRGKDASYLEDEGEDIILKGPLRPRAELDRGGEMFPG